MTLLYPTYSVAPFTYTANYTTLTLSWTTPTTGVEVSLVRNLFSTPANQTDGIVLLQAPIAQQNSFTGSPSFPASGGFIYYSIFVSDGTGAWWRAGDLQATVPGDWGYSDQLWNSIPSWYRYLDTQAQQTFAFSGGETWASIGAQNWTGLGATETWAGLTEQFAVNAGPPTEGPLQRFLALLATELDRARTLIEQLANVNSPGLIAGNLLPLLAHELGVGVEDALGMAQMRTLVASVVNLYKNKGTLPGIEAVVEAVTGWGAEVTISPNLVLMPDLIATLMTTNTGLETGLVGYDPSGALIMPADYMGAQGPGSLPGDAPVAASIPIQAWFPEPSLNLNLNTSALSFTSAIDPYPQSGGGGAVNPVGWGIPLPAPEVASQASTTTWADVASETWSSLPTDETWLGLSQSEDVQVITAPTVVVTLDVFLPEAVWGLTNWGQCAYGPVPIPVQPVAVDGDTFIIDPVILSTTVGTPYAGVLTVSNAAGPVQWSLASGVLPPGITLNTGTGTLSGIPPEAGSYPITVSAAEIVPLYIGVNTVISAAIRVWCAEITPTPEIIIRLHFWGEFGADLGMSPSSTVLLRDSEWEIVSIENVPVPTGAVWADIHWTLTGPGAMNWPVPITTVTLINFGWGSQLSTAGWGLSVWGADSATAPTNVGGIFVAAMPQFEVGSSLVGYTNPRDIQITLLADRANLLANPSFETGTTTGWAPLTNCIISATDTVAYIPPNVPNPGTWSCVVQAITGGDMSVISDPMPLEPGDLVTASAYVMPATTAENVAVSIEFLNAFGGSLGTVQGTLILEVPGAWVRPVAYAFPSDPAPAGSTSFQMIVTWFDVAGSEFHYLDAVLAEPTWGLDTYFDGSMWAGSPNEANYVWADAGTQGGPSWFYADLPARRERLRSVLAGDGSASYTQGSPFSTTGFIPWGRTFTLLTEQPLSEQVLVNPPTPNEWGDGRWSISLWGSFDNPIGGGWDAGLWGQAQWGESGTVFVPPPPVVIPTPPTPTGAILLIPAQIPVVATRGAGYSYQLVFGGGAGPYSVAVTTGSLMSALSLNAATGLITGTVGTSDVTNNVTFTITDSTSPTPQTASIQLTFTVIAGVSTLAITPVAAPVVMYAGSGPYVFSLTATGGSGTYGWVAISALPPGLSMSTAGVFSGSPTVLGNTNVTVQVTDSFGATAAITITITVSPAIAWGVGTWSTSAWSSTLPGAEHLAGSAQTLSSDAAAMTIVRHAGVTGVVTATATVNAPGVTRRSLETGSATATSTITDASPI